MGVAGSNNSSPSGSSSGFSASDSVGSMGVWAGRHNTCQFYHNFLTCYSLAILENSIEWSDILLYRSSSLEPNPGFRKGYSIADANLLIT